MAIAETQLATWSSQGSVTQSKDTYATVKRVIEARHYNGFPADVYLQGSYGNDTNIYGESDVDIVVCTNSIFYYDIAALTADERAAFAIIYPGSGGYSYGDFAREVQAQLSGAFGNDVVPGTKAMNIRAGGARRSADVLACCTFRQYSAIRHRAETFEAGVCFWATGRIVNFPKQHSVNCTAKHQATNGMFKPMVRILKNMRGRLVDKGALTTNTAAPSYFIEGLLYNAPNDLFKKPTYQAAFVDIVNWLWAADPQVFRCANEQLPLLGDSSTTWPSANCTAFLRAVIELWNKP